MESSNKIEKRYEKSKRDVRRLTKISNSAIQYTGLRKNKKTNLCRKMICKTYLGVKASFFDN